MMSGKMNKEKVEEKVLTNLVGQASRTTITGQLLVRKPPTYGKGSAAGGTL